MLNLLKKALLLSKDISELFNQEEWDKAQELQHQRDLLLKELPNIELPTESHELEQINNLSIEIKTITKEQLEISRTRKKGILQKIKNSNKSNKMKTAYGYKPN